MLDLWKKQHCIQLNVSTKHFNVVFLTCCLGPDAKFVDRHDSADAPRPGMTMIEQNKSGYENIFEDYGMELKKLFAVIKPIFL
jgi:hypothetical protein